MIAAMPEINYKKVLMVSWEKVFDVVLWFPASHKLSGSHHGYAEMCLNMLFCYPQGQRGGVLLDSC